jgi:hypothetical protein
VTGQLRVARYPGPRWEQMPSAMMPSDMEIGFLLSIIGILGGIWAYLYKAILELTIAAPSDLTLIFLCFTHFVVFAYLTLSLFAFYSTGRALLERLPPSEKSKLATRIVLDTWPITMIGLFVSFFLTKLSASEFGLKVSLIIFGCLTIGLSLFIKPGGVDRRTSFDIKFKKIGFLVVIIILSIPYMMVMSFFLSDVIITTDKEFYKPDEPIMINVVPSGYAFRSTLKNMSLGLFHKEINDDDTVVVTPKEYRDMNLIEVDYQTQVFGLNRKAYTTLKIAAKPPHQVN